jgi:tetratricopeptide (TPR) repeat protein
VDRVFQILKAINIREIDEAKELVKDDPYLVSGIINILRKSNQLRRAFSFLNFLQKEINEGTEPQIIDAYGWMIYDKVKAENQDIDEEQPEESFDSLLYDLDHQQIVVSNQENRSETIQLVLSTIPLLNPQSEYGAFSKLFRLVLKSEKHRPNTNWQFLSDLLSLINPDTLSQDCETVEFNHRGRQKKMELASDKEAWYAAQTQVLMEMGQYEKCIELSKASLEMFDSFHYGNDVWFARKIAKCQQQLGNVQDAIKAMEQVEQKKSEWFVQKELAELYFEQNELSKAKRMATKAALNYGDKEKKDGVYFLLGQIYKKQDQKEKAYKHFLLSQMIRQEEDWKIPQRLKFELEETKPEEFKDEYDSSSTLFKELLKFWKGNGPSIQSQGARREPNTKKIQGRISHVRHDKGFGFIIGDNEHEYFFRSDAVKTGFGDLGKGVKVIFKYKPPEVSGEGKKWNAYDIVIIK